MWKEQSAVKIVDEEQKSKVVRRRGGECERGKLVDNEAA